jgi:hypothetical protein
MAVLLRRRSLLRRLLFKHLNVAGAETGIHFRLPRSETAGIRGFASPRVKADKSDFNIRIVTGE